MENENFHCKYHKIGQITLIKIRKTHANFSEYSVTVCSTMCLCVCVCVCVCVLVLVILLVF